MAQQAWPVMNFNFNYTTNVYKVDKEGMDRLLDKDSAGYVTTVQCPCVILVGNGIRRN